MDARATTSLDFAIGARLKVARNRAGLSQQGLAAQLGITFQQVQKYENGKNRIAASRLPVIAKAVNRSIMYFYNGPRARAASAQRAPSLSPVPYIPTSPQRIALRLVKTPLALFEDMEQLRGYVRKTILDNFPNILISTSHAKLDFLIDNETAILIKRANLATIRAEKIIREIAHEPSIKTVIFLTNATFKKLTYAEGKRVIVVRAGLSAQ